MRKFALVATACMALASCAPATVDKQSVRATEGQPESTQVDVVRIPYDPNLPTYVVTVAPLRQRAELQSRHGDAAREIGRAHV